MVKQDALTEVQRLITIRGENHHVEYVLKFPIVEPGAQRVTRLQQEIRVGYGK